METQSHSILYYKDNTFSVEVEENSEGLFLHCLVTDWKLSSLKQMYNVFGIILNELWDRGYSRVITVTPNPKFAKLFGGVFEKEIYFNGTRHEVIVWEKVH